MTDQPTAGVALVSRDLIDRAAHALSSTALGPQLFDALRTPASGAVEADDIALMSCFVNNRGTPEDWAAWSRIRTALTSEPKAAPVAPDGVEGEVFDALTAAARSYMETDDTHMAGLLLHARNALAARAQPPAAEARCQDCGGEVQGWMCQSCCATFTENDNGWLIIHRPAAPAAEAVLLKALADIQFMRKDEPGQTDRHYAERAAEIARQTIAAHPAEPAVRGGGLLTEARDALAPFAEASNHLHPAHPEDGTTLDGIEVRAWHSARAAHRKLTEALAASGEK